MAFQASSWRQNIFLSVAIVCVLFIVLTTVAMLFYPGGTAADRTTAGYSFFTNFFSDLGLMQTRTGQPNTVSMILFVTALTLAGGGLMLFFATFPPLFTQSIPGRALSGLGSFFGILSGICFIGVGFTPADINVQLHTRFVLWAFGFFPIAAILYTIAILCQPRYPKHLALVFGVFAVLLVLYMGLLLGGPRPTTAEGLSIQVIGQKGIVYASIVTILIEALGARQAAKPK